jgi:hypothetical protein
MMARSLLSLAIEATVDLTHLYHEFGPVAMNPKRLPRIPVSWGELIDKIRSWRSRPNACALPRPAAMPVESLPCSRVALARLIDPPVGLEALGVELAAVNRRLWDIEDAIRQKEASQTFDAEFIALARSVYLINDERTRTKRAINELMQSNIIEEKHYVAYHGPP